MWVLSQSEAKPGVQLTLNDPPMPLLSCLSPASLSMASALRTSWA